MRYAREDTHHLLYIYDRMKNELIRRSDSKNDRLTEVLKRSRDICLKLYKKPTSSDTDYLKLYSKHKRKFNSQQVRLVIVRGQSSLYFDLSLPTHPRIYLFFPSPSVPPASLLAAGVHVAGPIGTSGG